MTNVVWFTDISTDFSVGEARRNSRSCDSAGVKGADEVFSDTALLDLAVLEDIWPPEM